MKYLILLKNILKHSIFSTCLFLKLYHLKITTHILLYTEQNIWIRWKILWDVESGEFVLSVVIVSESVRWN